jgi:hypothetical protein
MNKSPTQTKLESKNSGGQAVCSTWTSVPFDAIYEKRIFELECYIDQIEYLLVLAEMEISRYKRGNCA